MTPRKSVPIKDLLKQRHAKPKALMGMGRGGDSKLSNTGIHPPPFFSSQCPDRKGKRVRKGDLSKWAEFCVKWRVGSLMSESKGDFHIRQRQSGYVSANLKNHFVALI
ncbi:hypothetical protein HNY73_009241 [Argiope bruennichi]|uniref:Uncharacterized protein n=1 Tax=Argiope bruennichi TaxID=94029 RepID=A0A8T0FBK3_ARGBR|nr:hypothetical protein HNY73_009241 [Argiope bruennichi]